MLLRPPRLGGTNRTSFSPGMGSSFSGDIELDQRRGQKGQTFPLQPPRLGEGIGQTRRTAPPRLDAGIQPVSPTLQDTGTLVAQKRGGVSIDQDVLDEVNRLAMGEQQQMMAAPQLDGAVASGAEGTAAFRLARDGGSPPPTRIGGGQWTTPGLISPPPESGYEYIDGTDQIIVDGHGVFTIGLPDMSAFQVLRVLNDLPMNVRLAVSGRLDPQEFMDWLVSRGVSQEHAAVLAQGEALPPDVMHPPPTVPIDEGPPPPVVDDGPLSPPVYDVGDPIYNEQGVLTHINVNGAPMSINEAVQRGIIDPQQVATWQEQPPPTVEQEQPPQIDPWSGVPQHGLFEGVPGAGMGRWDDELMQAIRNLYDEEMQAALTSIRQQAAGAEREMAERGMGFGSPAVYASLSEEVKSASRKAASDAKIEKAVNTAHAIANEMIRQTEAADANYHAVLDRIANAPPGEVSALLTAALIPAMRRMGYPEDFIQTTVNQMAEEAWHGSVLLNIEPLLSNGASDEALVAWLQTQAYPNGTRPTEAEAKAWLEANKPYIDGVRDTVDTPSLNLIDVSGTYTLPDNSMQVALEFMPSNEGLHSSLLKPLSSTEVKSFISWLENNIANYDLSRADAWERIARDMISETGFGKGSSWSGGDNRARMPGEHKTEWNDSERLKAVTALLRHILQEGA